MAYKVLDVNGVGYSHEGGQTFVAKDHLIDDKVIAEGAFTPAGLAHLVKVGRLVEVKTTTQEVTPISPDNRKMPEVQKKESKPKPKTKGKK